MITTVLTFVDGSEASMAWLNSAAAFCQSHGARLRISALIERIPLEVRDAMTPVADEGEESFAPFGDDFSDIAFPRILAESGVDVEVSRVWRPFADLVARAARQSRLVDVVLVSPPSAWDDHPLRRRVIEAVVVNAGTPTLILPEGWHPALVRTVVLAWNGSSQAARAARALMSLVELGAKIDVLVVENGDGLSGEQTSLDITDQLASHGFEVETDIRYPDERDAAEVLQALARDHEAELLAVGGYSHSRLTERLFGGVSRELIAEPKVPVLMVG